MRRNQLKGFMDKFKQGIANDLVNAMVKRVAVDTGGLKGSIMVRPKGNNFEITMFEYGKYVEYGTPPHVIRPKNKKALAFKIDGRENDYIIYDYIPLGGSIFMPPSTNSACQKSGIPILIRRRRSILQTVT